VHDGVERGANPNYKGAVGNGGGRHDAVASRGFNLGQLKPRQPNCGLHHVVVHLLEPLEGNEVGTIAVTEEAIALGKEQPFYSPVF